MSQQWYSTFERWTSSDFKKLEKVKSLILQCTKGKEKNDIPAIMSELSNDSTTSLCGHNKFQAASNFQNVTKPQISNKAGVVIIKDQLENKAEMSINLDLIPDSSADTIQIDDFKFKIVKELCHDTKDDYKIIKVNIILPKGSSYNFSPENTDDDNVEGNKKQTFKPEHFSVLNESFLSFANSLIDMGSTDFTAAKFTSSSPIPELDETEDQSEIDSLNQILHVNYNDAKETLNNTTNIPPEKDIKTIQFIKNTSTDSLELSLTEKRNCISLSESRQSITTELLDKVSETAARSCTYYDDLKKWNCYDRNLKHENLNKSVAPNVHCKTNRSIAHNREDMELFQFSITNSVVNKQVPDVSKVLANSTVNIPPIMGKNALLAKSNITKSQRDTLHGKTDSEIIEEIVRDKFREFLAQYNSRSMKRKAKTQKQSSESEDKEDGVECVFKKQPENNHEITFEKEKNENDHINSNTDLIIPEIKIIANSVASSNDQVNESTYNVEHEGCVTPEMPSSKVNLLLDLPVLSAASSMTTCASRDFGEFIESGLFDSECLLSDGIEYDSQKFLEAALGEDFNQYATLYNEPFDDSYTTYASRFAREISEDHSIGTSEMSALMSGQSMCTLPEMHSKHFRKTINDVIDEESVDLSSLTNTTDMKTNDELLSNLIAESAIQFQIIQQTSKALHLCKSIKEFEDSPEQIEAEKILLTATCQREVILNELKKLQMGESMDSTAYPGSIRLSDFKFPAKIFNQLNNSTKRGKDYTQWFVAIINCGTVLFATDAITADFEGNVYFNTQVPFDNLRPDFEITVSIYVMTVKNSLRTYSHESKYHLNKHSKAACPSPSKFLSFRRRSTPRIPEPTLKPSSFTSWGTASIRIGNLGKTGSFQMKNVPKCSTLCGQLLVTIESFVTINEQHSGFLHIGTQTSTNLVSWNRRWCSLFDTELRLWNDPVERGKPVETIDLRLCINSSISAVDRSICARPKTLLLETNNANRQIIRYFLNADSIDDMKKWEKVFNSVVSSLRLWNCMKCNSVSNLDETSL